MRWRVGVTVAYVDRSVQKFAPLFLFGGVGQGCAERGPDQFEWDLHAELDRPVGLTARSGRFVL